MAGGGSALDESAGIVNEAILRTEAESENLGQGDAGAQQSDTPPPYGVAFSSSTRGPASRSRIIKGLLGSDAAIRVQRAPTDVNRLQTSPPVTLLHRPSGVSQAALIRDRETRPATSRLQEEVRP